MVVPIHMSDALEATVADCVQDRVFGKEVPLFAYATENGRGK